MTKAPTATEKSKKQPDNTKMPPKASITQRLQADLGQRMIIWSNDSHPTDLVKPVCGIPIFPITAKAVKPLKYAAFKTTPMKNPSVVQKYSEKKCSETLPLSNNCQNIYFIRLIMEQITGENSLFSVKPRRNVDLFRNPCEFDTRLRPISCIFMEKLRAQKLLSVTSSFLMV